MGNPTGNSWFNFFSSNNEQKPNAWGLRAMLVLGFTVGGVIGACATTDQNLEKQRLLEELEKAGKGPKAQCKPGSVGTCYSGPQGTQGRGICKEGTQQCNQQAQWGICTGEVVPRKELCNRVDDDCDGIVDNDFERDGAMCFIGTGSCKTQGVWHCAPDGSKAVCDAPPPPKKPEVCDGEDNDCNGQIDDGFIAGTGSACTTTKPGVCSTGVMQCNGGRIQCVQTIQASIEICDKLDNDCNGKVDDNCLTAEEAAQLKNK